MAGLGIDMSEESCSEECVAPSVNRKPPAKPQSRLAGLDVQQAQAAAAKATAVALKRPACADAPACAKVPRAQSVATETLSDSHVGQSPVTPHKKIFGKQAPDASTEKAPKRPDESSPQKMAAAEPSSLPIKVGDIKDRHCFACRPRPKKAAKLEEWEGIGKC